LDWLLTTLNLSGYYDNLGKIEKAIQLQEVCLEVLGIEHWRHSEVERQVEGVSNQDDERMK
jgi:hypothetical protein